MSTKFAPGDRVKAMKTLGSEGHSQIEAGKVYTVRALDHIGDPILDTDKASDEHGWSSGMFELYAKAGEFVAGDRIIRKAESDASWSSFEHGVVLTVTEPLPSIGAIPGRVWAKAGNIGPYHADAMSFRLATAEEIAAADAPKAKFKAGDKVRVARKVESKTSGWTDVWTENMDEQVGQVLTVNGKNEFFGESYNLSDGYNYPTAALELVTETKGDTVETSQPPPVLPGRSGPHDFRVGDRVRRIASPIEGVRAIGDIVTVVERPKNNTFAASGSVFYEEKPGTVTWSPDTHHELVEDADGWRPWGGGENPVPGEKCAVRLRSESKFSEWTAASEGWRWSETGNHYDIVAYRVDKPAVVAEPKTTNFKIGDIVVVHDEGYATNHGFKLNHNYTVEHVDGEDGDGCDLVLLKGKSKYDRIYAKRLSLVARPVVEEPKAEPAPWKFAVGDVVECVKGWEHYYTVGKRYTVKKSETGSLYVKRDDGCIGFGHLAQEGNFRIAIPAGGFRMGDIVELVQPISTGSNPGYTANVGDRFVVHSGNVEILRPDGQVFKGGGWGPDRFRLVERPHQDFFQKQAEPIDLAVKREPRVGRISTPWHKGSLLDLLFEAKTSAPRFEDLIGKPFTIKLPDFKFEAGETFFGKRSELGWAEPDPIKSGDRIIDNETTSTGRVIIVDGDYAWVLLDGKKRPVTRPLGNIELL